MTAIQAAEWKRKCVHIGSGFFAFLLPLLTWRQAALAALDVGVVLLLAPAGGPR